MGRQQYVVEPVLRSSDGRSSSRRVGSHRGVRPASRLARAVEVDSDDRKSAPLVFTFVLYAFLFMLVSFRSLVIAAQAIIL